MSSMDGLGSIPYKIQTIYSLNIYGERFCRQHVVHFKILTGTIVDQDALKIRLFASTLKGTAFDWYSTLPEDSIQNWTMLETRFLTHFKGEDHPVTMA